MRGLVGLVANFQAVFYRDPSGGEPVREALDALDYETQAAIEHQIGRLNLLSDTIPHLPFPHSSQVDGELRELRCHHGRQLFRILYRRSARLLILLHIFAKRSAKIDQREIHLANERWEDFRARMDAQPRVPPRAAGRDAP
jgi:phage-related protein